MTPPSLADWLAGGQRVAWGGFEIFCRPSGAGRWITLLHGFPTSSWDWARIAPGLEAGHRLLAFDFLGFGDSDKPARHDYSLVSQADLVEGLWDRFDVRETLVLAHDYGVSVGQELLARASEGRATARIRGVLFLNGGLYSDLHRPRLVQSLLRWPVLGPLVGRLMNQGSFSRALSEVFAPSHRLDAGELAQHWQAVSRRDGLRVAHRLIAYIDERRLHHERWVRALETTPVPLGFAWGLADPVSGAHVAERLRTRLPSARLRELTGVGHYPQIEVPDAVLEEALALDRRAA